MKESEDGSAWVTVLDSWVSQDAALHEMGAGEREGAREEASLLNEQPNSQSELLSILPWCPNRFYVMMFRGLMHLCLSFSRGAFVLMGRSM